VAVKKNFDQSAQAVPPKKSGNRKWWIGGSAFAFIFIIFLLYNPQATIHYGVCKVYIELNEPYPEKIKYLGMEDFGQFIRIIYRRIDPFGVISVNTVECTFKIEDGVVTPYLLSVDINGKRKAYEAENPVRVEAFNKSVPTIEANPPDLRVPYFPLDDMSAYRDFYNSDD
jgi:hypothetical protein